MEVYIVISAQGIYEEYRTSIERVFDSEAKARQYIDDLKAKQSNPFVAPTFQEYKESITSEEEAIGYDNYVFQAQDAYDQFIGIRYVIDCEEVH